MELGNRKEILVEQEAKGVWDTGVKEIQEVGEKQERNIKCQLPFNDLFVTSHAKTYTNGFPLNG